MSVTANGNRGRERNVKRMVLVKKVLAVEPLLRDNDQQEIFWSHAAYKMNIVAATF